MASESIKTGITVKDGQRVILNLGLTGGSTVGRLLPQQRTVIYATMLREMLMPGYAVELQLMPGYEPVMVASGEFRTDASCSLLLWDAVVIAEQDCVAVYYPELDEGYLFGPRSDLWGEFDKLQFSMPVVVKVLQ